MLPVRWCGLPTSSPSLNVGVGESLELASQVLTQLVNLDVAQLGIGLGGLHERRGERLVGGEQVGLRLGSVRSPAQPERLRLEVLGQRLDALAVGLGKHAPAGVHGTRDADPDRCGRRGTADH